MGSASPFLYAAINGRLIIDMALAVVIGTGVAMVLSSAPWFRRRPTASRILPYVATTTGNRRSGRGGDLGLRGTLEPTLEWLGNRLSSTLGVVTDLDTRLRRAGRQKEPYAFRIRQVLFATIALAVGIAAAVLISPSGPLLAGLVIGLPTIALLGSEELLSRQIAVRSNRLEAELPVVIEQLGMLISAGFSLTSAVAHIASRGSGVVATDLRDVSVEIRRGVEPRDAFADWAATSGLASVEKVVAVLALNSEASDLGALISAEARSIRAGAHRNLLEAIERRAQLVWIPVTVATLVPGLIFLAVPFYAAMAQVTGG